MSAQLPLLESPKLLPKPKGGSNGVGRRGLLKRLQQQGLEPDATVIAARLVALLDDEPVRGDGR